MESKFLRDDFFSLCRKYGLNPLKEDNKVYLMFGMSGDELLARLSDEKMVKDVVFYK